MNKTEKCWEECKSIMKEFVDPYLYKTCVEIDSEGYLVYAYTDKPVAYDSIMGVVRMMINGSYRFEFLFQTGKRRREDGMGFIIKDYLLPIVNQLKDPRDYQYILRIIFSMIHNGVCTKNEFVDNLKDTDNLPVLLELIKYDNFTVMTDNHRFDLA